MSFDLIVCTGVLHHLADPDAGLRALHDVLKPDGAMHLMVYAPYGRAGIYLLQDFCRRHWHPCYERGHSGSYLRAQRLARRAIRWRPCCVKPRTFERKRRLPMLYCIPRTGLTLSHNCLDFIAAGGLTFSRWVRQAPYSVRCGVISKIPQATRISRLPLAEQYAAIELFRGTMVRHSLIAHRNDADYQQVRSALPVTPGLSMYPSGYLTPSVSKSGFRPGPRPFSSTRLTATRISFCRSIQPKSCYSTLLTESRTSARSWTQRCLSLRSAATNFEVVRSFFERLWWHDQVVFDASASAAS